VLGHRLFFGLLPALLALLLHAPVAAAKQPSLSDVAAAESVKRGKPLPAAVDLTTKSRRHAASIEEYFAIDDDADPYAKWPAQAATLLTTPFTLVAELRSFVYDAVAQSHPRRAAPSTGPPHA
jgi:hypothetical protein